MYVVLTIVLCRCTTQSWLDGSKTEWCCVCGCDTNISLIKDCYGIQCCHSCQVFLSRLAKWIQVDGKTYDFCKNENKGKECERGYYCVYHKYQNAVKAGFKLEGIQFNKPTYYF